MFGLLVGGELFGFVGEEGPDVSVHVACLYGCGHVGEDWLGGEGVGTDDGSGGGLGVISGVIGAIRVGRVSEVDYVGLFWGHRSGNLGAGLDGDVELFAFAPGLDAVGIWCAAYKTVALVDGPDAAAANWVQEVCHFSFSISGGFENVKAKMIGVGRSTVKMVDRVYVCLAFDA